MRKFEIEMVPDTRKHHYSSVKEALQAAMKKTITVIRKNWLGALMEISTICMLAFIIHLIIGPFTDLS